MPLALPIRLDPPLPGSPEVPSLTFTGAGFPVRRDEVVRRTEVNAVVVVVAGAADGVTVVGVVAMLITLSSFSCLALISFSHKSCSLQCWFIRGRRNIELT